MNPINYNQISNSQDNSIVNQISNQSENLNQNQNELSNISNQNQNQNQIKNQEQQYNIHITSNYPISKCETNYKPINKSNDKENKNNKNSNIKNDNLNNNNKNNNNTNKLSPLIAEKIDKGANIPYNIISRPSNDLEDYDDPNKAFQDLLNYKDLCELYIKKLKPNVDLPITRQDLYSLKAEKKEDESNESNESDNYSELEQNYNDALEALKKQTLLNDQMKSYIEVLKQTLESNLVKNGLSSLIPTTNDLNESKSFYNENGKFYSPQKLNDLIDISKLTSENQKIKDELSKSKLYIKDLEDKVSLVNKDKQDLLDMNFIYKDKINNLQNRGENMNEKLLKSQQDTEKDHQNIEILKVEKNRLNDELSECKTICNKYENEINDNKRLINELNNKLNQLRNTENKYEDTKELYDKLDYDHKRLLNEKIHLDDKNKKLNEKINELKENQENLNKYFDNYKIENEEEKKRILEEKDELISNIIKSKEEKDNLENIIHDKEKAIVNLKKIQIQNEKKNLELESINNEIIKKFDEYKNDAEVKIKILSSKNDNLTKEISKIDDLYKQSQTDNLGLSNDILSFKSQLYEINNINEKLINENADLKNYLEQSNKQYDLKNEELINTNEIIIKLKNENDILKKELPYWKEKYDKDINDRIIEGGKLKKNLNDMKLTLDELEIRNNKITHSNNQLLMRNNELESNLSDLHKNFVKVKEDNTILSDELYEKLKQIEIDNETKRQILEKNNEQSNQIKLLEDKIENVIDQKNQIEHILGEQNNKYNILKDNHEENNIKLNSLIDNLNSQYKIIQDCCDLIQTYSIQIRRIAYNENNKDIYLSNHFNKFISSCDLLSSSKSLSPLEKLKIIKNFLTETSVENFDWYNKIIYLDEANKLLDDKNILLNSKINDFKDTVHDANEYISTNENKVKSIIDDNLNFKQSYNDLLNKYNKKNDKLNCISSELNDLQDQNFNLTKIVSQLNQENIEKDKQLNKTSFELNALEKKIDILNREKETCERSLEQIYNNTTNNSKLNNDSFLNISNPNNNSNNNYQYLTTGNYFNNSYNSKGSDNKKNFYVSNRFKNSYIRNWINDTERLSTSPISEYRNISGKSNL